ncbi:MAG: hypothetical protein F6K61_04040 [Sphaerospermopsis sp. SIO1G1]|nr:hypothetical protein [Sphaerospermopsis sp. SIO1G1]
MKKYFTVIFIAITLLVSNSCSSNTVKSDKIENNNPQNTKEITTKESNTKNSQKTTKPASEKMSEPQEHSMKKSSNHSVTKIATQAKLSTPETIAANQSLNLSIDILDQTGKPVNKFDVFQEKMMHLIVVSNDLEHFDHLHPEYKGNGRFQVSTKFPNPGEYVLFSDYKPAGKAETVSLTNLKIPGNVPLPKSLAKYEKIKTISDTKINLKYSPEKIKAGKDVHLTFYIQDQDNQAVKDLKPYLGEKGHLVIIKSSSVLTESDYIHAHAMKNSPDENIKFHTKFPQPGTYKMWMQFNRNGKIKTADFWVNVE